MTNTTNQYWSVDGVSIQTYAKNISTISGKDTPPKFRGSNLIIPGTPGEFWVKKQVDSRTLTLGMWVRGASDDLRYGKSSRNSFEDNWRSLRNLLWQPGRQLRLTKRIRVGGSIISVTALAEFAGGLEPTPVGRTAAKFTVDLKLADPYFYDDTARLYTLANGLQTLDIPGDGLTNNIRIKVNGARSNLLVRNNTLGMQVQYADVLTSGSLLDIDVLNFRATTTPSGVAPYNSTARVRHSGDPQWLTIRGGTNQINFTSTAGAGVTTMEVRSAWL